MTHITDIFQFVAIVTGLLTIVYTTNVTVTFISLLASHYQKEQIFREHKTIELWFAVLGSTLGTVISVIATWSLCKL